jgi:uncharacterized iron-regulated membrane protein
VRSIQPEGFESAAPADGVQPLKLADVARVLTERTQRAVLTGFHVPSSPYEAFTVYYRGPDEPMSGFGRSALWIDQYTGQVLHAYEYDGKLGEQIVRRVFQQ